MKVRISRLSLTFVMTKYLADADLHYIQANSIEGCKLKEVEVVYTRWRNLKKTKSMEVGQVGFNDPSKVCS